MELYLSDPDAALAGPVPLLDSSSGNIAVVHPCCDRVLVVRKSALVLEIKPDFQSLLKPEHPEYFFLSLRCHSTHGPVTPTSDAREISGIFMQCVGQLICVPPCHECRNAPQPSTTSNRLFFNLCVTAGDKDHGIAHLCGSCLVQPDPNQTCTSSKSAFSSIRHSILTDYSSAAQITSGAACALYHLPYHPSTSRAFQYLPNSGVSGMIKNRVLEDWDG